jgi:hypothetical protein
MPGSWKRGLRKVTLLLKTLRARPERERDVIDALRQTAITMIECSEAEAILICSETSDPGRIIWIEHRCSGSQKFSSPPSPPVAALDGMAIVCATQRLRFVDGFYHFPFPLCRVWTLDVHPSGGRHLDGLKDLLELARRAFRDDRVIGMSIYRTTDEVATLVGFLALKQGLTPVDLRGETSGDCLWPETLDTTMSWRPLSVKWTLGRLSSGASPAAPAVLYPRTAFWARSNVLRVASVAPVGLSELRAAGRRTVSR